jgi:homoserine O-succinyltransferase
VVDWACENVTSVLCSCLATHAVMHFHHGQPRRPLPAKRWGVFPHRVKLLHHPLVNDVNTQFDVPHSRFNDISRAQFEAAGLHVLAESEAAGVHLAVSADGVRVVYFQGHPEYDTVSLLKEYKREVLRYAAGDRPDYPPLPEHYLKPREQAILDEFRQRVESARRSGSEPPAFPEALVAGRIDNTWHDTAEGIVGNWMGLVYQLTHHERKRPFMEGIDPHNPLGMDFRQ